jgi:C1A family cysteine protease
MALLKKLWHRLLVLIRVRDDDIEVLSFKGWVNDSTDPRDRIFEVEERALVSERSTLPPEVDLRGRFRTAIENQGSTNSCVGHAVTSFVEALTRSTVDKSRLFVYWNSRSFEGTTHVDNGTQIRNAMRSISAFGLADESVWPYNTTLINVKPSDAAYSNGLPVKNTIAAYERITTLQGMKAALASGRGVVFGFQVPRTFVTDTRFTGVLPFPPAGTQFIGGHAVVAVGYNDRTGMVLCRNSYGTSWGKEGYFEMPYAWFANMNSLVADAWTIRLK